MTWSRDGGLYLVYAILHLAAAFLGLLHAFARVRTANACSRSCYRFVPHAGSVAVKLVIRDSWWGFETRTSRFVARRSLAVSPRPRSRDCQCHRRSLSRHPRVSPRFRRRLRRASKTENLRYTPKSRPESHITTPHTPRQKAKADISTFAPRTERLGFRLNVAPAARASERRGTLARLGSKMESRGFFFAKEHASGHRDKLVPGAMRPIRARRPSFVSFVCTFNEENANLPGERELEFVLEGWGAANAPRGGASASELRQSLESWMNSSSATHDLTPHGPPSRTRSHATSSPDSQAASCPPLPFIPVSTVVNLSRALVVAAATSPALTLLELSSALASTLSADAC